MIGSLFQLPLPGRMQFIDVRGLVENNNNNKKNVPIVGTEGGTA